MHDCWASFAAAAAADHQIAVPSGLAARGLLMTQSAVALSFAWEQLVPLQSSDGTLCVDRVAYFPFRSRDVGGCLTCVPLDLDWAGDASDEADAGWVDERMKAMGCHCQVDRWCSLAVLESAQTLGLHLKLMLGVYEAHLLWRCFRDLCAWAFVSLAASRQLLVSKQRRLP